MICLYYLLFVSLIPISTTIRSKLAFAFFNDVNIIRCSDSQVQVYRSEDTDKLTLERVTHCDNKDEIIDPSHSGFLWGTLNIICSSPLGQVYEEQYVEKAFHSHEGRKMLPNPKGLLSPAKKPYELHAKSSDEGYHITIQSNNQPASNEYFSGKRKRRIIYLQFPDHPIICRIEFIGEENNPCSSGKDHEADVESHICYYNPGANVEPTSEEMEAEMKQITISSDKLSDSDENTSPDNPSIIDPGKKKKTDPKTINPKEGQNKSNLPTIIGFAVGITLLLALVGGVAFYFLRKNRSNQASAGRIDAGHNKRSRPSDASQSEELLGDDPNHGIPANDRSAKDQTNMKLQTSTGQKQQRTVNNLAFSDDV